jgi:hypothetical protein
MPHFCNSPVNANVRFWRKADIGLTRVDDRF